jgi:hypothetical protein
MLLLIKMIKFKIIILITILKKIIITILKIIIIIITKIIIKIIIFVIILTNQQREITHKKTNSFLYYNSINNNSINKILRAQLYKIINT